MAKILQCPRCLGTRSWAIRRGKRRCCACKYEWRANRLPLYLTRSEWECLIERFLLGESAIKISKEANLGREQVLRALALIREAMVYNMPNLYRNTAEVNEAYPGVKPESKHQNIHGRWRELGSYTVNKAIFGICCLEGQIWAEIVPGIEADAFLPQLKNRAIVGTPIHSSITKKYTYLATKKHFYFCAEQNNLGDRQANYTEDIEHFWRYLKGMLSIKNGIRKGNLPLHLAEYVWRYNHRNSSLRDQMKYILSLLQIRHNSSG